MIHVYTAGAMSKDKMRYSVAPWRTEFETCVQKENYQGLDIKFLHPELSGCDHQGVDVEGTVAANRIAFKRAEVVVAYLERPDQHGTIAEMYWARSFNKPLIVAARRGLFDKSGTGHRCSCMMEGHTVYWYVEVDLKIQPIVIKKDLMPLAKAFMAVCESSLAVS